VPHLITVAQALSLLSRVSTRRRFVTRLGYRFIGSARESGGTPILWGFSSVVFPGRPLHVRHKNRSPSMLAGLSASPRDVKCSSPAPLARKSSSGWRLRAGPSGERQCGCTSTVEQEPLANRSGRCKEFPVEIGKLLDSIGYASVLRCVGRGRIVHIQDNQCELRRELRWSRSTRIGAIEP